MSTADLSWMVQDIVDNVPRARHAVVLSADGVPRGSAADVAPDGFAHPVFRSGFALSIRLPEVH